jgi:hypothetical protein
MSMTGARCVAHAGGRPHYKGRQNWKANTGTSTSAEWNQRRVQTYILQKKLVLYADNVSQRLKPADLVELSGAA